MMVPTSSVPSSKNVSTRNSESRQAGLSSATGGRTAVCGGRATVLETASARASGERLAEPLLDVLGQSGLVDGAVMALERVDGGGMTPVDHQEQRRAARLE